MYKYVCIKPIHILNPPPSIYELAYFIHFWTQKLFRKKTFGVNSALPVNYFQVELDLLTVTSRCAHIGRLNGYMLETLVCNTLQSVSKFVTTSVAYSKFAKQYGIAASYAFVRAWTTALRAPSMPPRWLPNLNYSIVCIYPSVLFSQSPTTPRVVRGGPRDG